MKKGFGLVPVLIGVGIVIILAVVAAAAVNLNNNQKIGASNGSNTDKNFNLLDKLEQKLTNRPDKTVQPIPPATPTPKVTPTPTPTPQPASGGAAVSFTYTQSQGIYIITLPAGWVVGSTFATQTYSSTTFNGSQGNVTITFGTGKDPLGGCSEASSVVLADRTVSGCYLLQQNGSRILTRVYTTTAGHIPVTVEAFISPPLATNQPIIKQVVGTIDIR